MTREEAIDAIREMLRVEKTWNLTLNHKTIAAFECALSDMEKAQELEGFTDEPKCPRCDRCLEVWPDDHEHGDPEHSGTCPKHGAYSLDTLYRVGAKP